MHPSDIALLRKIATSKGFKGESTDPAFQAMVQRFYDLTAMGYIEMPSGTVKRGKTADKGFTAVAPRLTEQGHEVLLMDDR